MDVTLILAIIAFVLAVPLGTLLAALMAPRRGRWLSLFGAVIGAALTDAAVYFYARSIRVDGLSYFLGALLATVTGALIGALVVSFFLSLGGRRARNAAQGL